jgi:2-oxoisovalerate dehydrogenase E1 component alpha subunit
MIRVEEYDKVGLMCQRQGKISFYLTSFGEIGAIVGSAAALINDDPV